MHRVCAAVVLGVAFLFTMTLVTPARAADTKKEQHDTKEKVSKAKAQKARGGAGADENIKDDSEKNNPDPQAAPAAPPEKGGEKTRARSACYVSFDNWTPYLIKAYVNGVRVGTVSPWGTASGYQPGGTVILYGKAEFVDGTIMTWGPDSIYCINAGYRWQLTP